MQRRFSPVLRPVGKKQDFRNLRVQPQEILPRLRAAAYHRATVIERTWPRVTLQLQSFGVGFLVGLVGDACHLASGTTRYPTAWMPTLGLSAIWFPFLVGVSVAGLASVGYRLGLPRRARGRRELALGCSLVLARYALTALLRGVAPLAGVVLCAALAIAVWLWWDPSGRALALAVLAALVGPAVEIGLVAVGAVEWATEARGLFGVAAWLPCLYFAAAAIASGLCAALESPRESPRDLRV